MKLACWKSLLLLGAAGTADGLVGPTSMRSMPRSRPRVVRGLQMASGPSPWRPIAAVTLAAAIMVAPSEISIDMLHPSVASVHITPPSAEAKTALRGKNGALSSPSDSGLGLFVDQDGVSLLRLAVPDTDSNAREVQGRTELVLLRLQQVGFSGKPQIWKACEKDVEQAAAVLTAHSDEFVGKVAPKDQAEAKIALASVSKNLEGLKQTIKDQNYEATKESQTAAANDMAKVREMMAYNAPGGALTYTIPDEYDSLPRLLGRATVEMVIKTKAGKEKVTMVLDGFHAPLIAGNMANLVKTGAFDGVAVEYAEELIVQVSKGKATPNVPLELFYRGDTEPTYSYTPDEDGRGSDTQILPFQSYGALGFSHPTGDNDGGSNQFFWFKYDQGLVAPGRNTFDGSYTCFGYTTENAAAIQRFKAGDVIEKATIVSGAGNLKPKA